MNDLSWIDQALSAARPQVVGALMRYFRDLDTAEEAFQEACLRALKNWPQKGPPRDPAAWLIFVGRNAGVDDIRKRSRQQALPDEEVLSDLEDTEPSMAERLDNADYRDDVLRLLFICCHPDLPATQQIAMALRIVSGLTVPEIARAFLVSEAAMEQRITRAKRTVAAAACDEAIRLGYLLLRMYPGEPELMGLWALMLFQHARVPARLAPEGELVLRDEQDRSLWRGKRMAEAAALIEKAAHHNRPGTYPLQAGIAYEHAKAKQAADTDWRAIDQYYQMLETLQPSPVITLNRAVAVSKHAGAAEALRLIEPLSGALDGYFHFHGVRGALLLELGRAREARTAFEKAISFAKTTAEASHIRRHLDRLQKGAEGMPA